MHRSRLRQTEDGPAGWILIVISEQKSPPMSLTELSALKRKKWAKTVQLEPILDVDAQLGESASKLSHPGQTTLREGGKLQIWGEADLDTELPKQTKRVQALSHRHQMLLFISCRLCFFFFITVCSSM